MVIRPVSEHPVVLCSVGVGGVAYTPDRSELPDNSEDVRRHGVINISNDSVPLLVEMEMILIASAAMKLLNNTQPCCVCFFQTVTG